MAAACVINGCGISCFLAGQCSCKQSQTGPFAQCVAPDPSGEIARAKIIPHYPSLALMAYPSPLSGHHTHMVMQISAHYSFSPPPVVSCRYSRTSHQRGAHSRQQNQHLGDLGSTQLRGHSVCGKSEVL